MNYSEKWLIELATIIYLPQACNSHVSDYYKRYAMWTAVKGPSAFNLACTA